MDVKVYELSDIIDFEEMPTTTTTTPQKPPEIATKIYKYNLLYNIHDDLNSPQQQPPVKPSNSTSNDLIKTLLVKGDYQYFHYNCDALNDSGWGCGYRTLQSLCSYVSLKQNPQVMTPAIPSINEIQGMLVQLGDKPNKFHNSREWIGAVEVSYILDFLYNVPCKIVHTQPHRRAGGLQEHIRAISEHFETKGSLCMMGGDADAASKAIAGIHFTGKAADDVYLLIIDPHYAGRPQSKLAVIHVGYVRWQHLKDFNQSSFYNICMPQI